MAVPVALVVVVVVAAGTEDQREARIAAVVFATAILPRAAPPGVEQHAQAGPEGEADQQSDQDTADGKADGGSHRRAQGDEDTDVTASRHATILSSAIHTPGIAPDGISD